MLPAPSEVKLPKLPAIEPVAVTEPALRAATLTGGVMDTPLVLAENTLGSSSAMQELLLPEHVLGLNFTPLLPLRLGALPPPAVVVQTPATQSSDVFMVGAVIEWLIVASPVVFSASRIVDPCSARITLPVPSLLTTNGVQAVLAALVHIVVAAVQPSLLQVELVAIMLLQVAPAGHVA